MRTSASKPGAGIVTWRTTACNQHGEPVVKFFRTNLVAAGGTTPLDSIGKERRCMGVGCNGANSLPRAQPQGDRQGGSENANLVFLDLEELGHRFGKVAAGSNISDGLNKLDWGSKTRACRINPVSTQWCHGDVIEIVSGAGQNFDVVIIPKGAGPARRVVR